MKSEWQACTIGELCDSVSVTYRGEDERVVLVNTSDVLNGKVLNHTDEPNQNLKGQFKKTFKRNDILYSEIRPANRRFAYIDFDETEKYIASTKLMVIRYRENVVEPKFLYFLLTSNDVIGELQRLAETRSGTFPQITFPAEVATLPVNLPPLPIQRKIASILSALDDKIETNNAICRNLEEQAMSLYKSWFVDFEPFQNQDFINTAIGIIPSDWTVGKLGSIANIVTGKRPKRKTADKNEHDNVPILGASGIMGYTNESMYRSKILVIGRVGTLGVVQRVEKDCWPSDNALVIQSPYYEYVKQILVRFDYLSINRGSTQPLITQTDIKNICVIIPPQHILKQFEYRVGKCMNLYSLLLDETKKLEEMREALLPKLMSGELTV